jgi:hypothetical protein
MQKNKKPIPSIGFLFNCNASSWRWWVTVLVGFGLTSAREKNNQNDDANKRYKYDELPPTAAPGVMKATCADRKARQKRCKRINEAKKLGSESINNAEDDGNDEGEQKVKPEFRAMRATAKRGVLL